MNLKINNRQGYGYLIVRQVPLYQEAQAEAILSDKHTVNNIEVGAVLLAAYETVEWWFF